MGGQAAQKSRVASLGRGTPASLSSAPRVRKHRSHGTLARRWGVHRRVEEGPAAVTHRGQDPEGVEGISRQLCGRDVGALRQSWPRAWGTHAPCSVCTRRACEGTSALSVGPPSLLAALLSPRGPPGPPRWHRGPSGSPGTPAGLPADCRGRWESFVEETLTETNRRNAVDLVSGCGAAPEARHGRPGVGLAPTCCAVAGEHPPPSSLE